MLKIIRTNGRERWRSIQEWKNFRLDIWKKPVNCAVLENNFPYFRTLLHQSPWELDKKQSRTFISSPNIQKKTNHSTSLHRMERGKKGRENIICFNTEKKEKKGKKWTFFLSSFVATTTTTRHLNLLGWFLCFRNIFSSFASAWVSDHVALFLSVYRFSGKRKLKIFLSSEIMNFHIVIPADVAVLLALRRLVKRKKVSFCVQLWNLAGDMLCMLSVGGKDAKVEFLSFHVFQNFHSSEKEKNSNNEHENSIFFSSMSSSMLRHGNRWTKHSNEDDNSDSRTKPFDIMSWSQRAFVDRHTDVEDVDT